MKLLNLAWLGKENCNKIDPTRKGPGTYYVSDVEDPELDKAVTEAHYRMHSTERVKITVHVHKSGKKSYSLE